MTKSEYMVIGAGQFGRSVSRSLMQLGQSVFVIDRQQHLIENIANEVDAAVAADATDEKTLRDLGVTSFSTVIVAIGTEAVEASILATALLNQLGVPRIVARATDRLHARVLQTVGAHKVINPEEEMGRRLATLLAHPTIKDQLELGNASLAEIQVPEQFVGRSLQELGIRGRYKVTVIALRRGERVIPSPEAKAVLESGDMILLIGAAQAVQAVADMA